MVSLPLSLSRGASRYCRALEGFGIECRFVLSVDQIAAAERETCARSRLCVCLNFEMRWVWCPRRPLHSPLALSFEPHAVQLNQVDVFFILAKGYLSHELGMLGFPAYDRTQQLLGFYKEVQSQVGQTQVRPVELPTGRGWKNDQRASI